MCSDDPLSIDVESTVPATGQLLQHSKYPCGVNRERLDYKKDSSSYSSFDEAGRGSGSALSNFRVRPSYDGLRLRTFEKFTPLQCVPC